MVQFQQEQSEFFDFKNKHKIILRIRWIGYGVISRSSRIESKSPPNHIELLTCGLCGAENSPMRNYLLSINF